MSDVDDGSKNPEGTLSEDGHLVVRGGEWVETELGQHDRWLRQAPDLFGLYQSALEVVARQAQEIADWRGRFVTSERFRTEDGHKHINERLQLESQVSRQAQEIQDLRTERDDLKGFTVSALAKHMGQGEMKYGSAWAWLVSRENLLRKVQAALQTHKSDAPTAEAAIDDRLAVLKSVESSRDALREALKKQVERADEDMRECCGSNPSGFCDACAVTWEHRDDLIGILGLLAETPTEGR